MHTREHNQPLSISLLALPETTPASLYGLHEVFSAVGVTWEQLTGEKAAARTIVPRIVTRDGRSIRSPVGLPIAAEAGLSEVSQTDVVIVTDLAITGDPRGLWRDEAEWVRARQDAGALIASVCTGSLFLAEAGLLNGCEATTHWSAAQTFRIAYPEVRLRPERIFCPAGEGHRIITGGGVSAWHELALYLIARFCGEEEARRISKIFVIGDRSDGQLPFSAMGRPAQHEDAAVATAQAWISQNYASPNPVARMVSHSGLAARTFKRRFRIATGYVPVDYVQALRIEEAKQMLETTSDPIEAIAGEVGYEDPAFFRRLFKRRTGITPARYRQRFQDVLQFRV
jgi:transcriptional regulator GlxA family with amidase domain